LTSAYERLLALARSAHACVLDGDLEGLERIDAERTALIAALPDTPPEAAKPLLVETAALQAQTTTALVAERDRIAGELADVQRVAQTARGYGRLATPARGTFTAAA
jgi:hypothetical protein